jgi:hypothetical protein
MGAWTNQEKKLTPRVTAPHPATKYFSTQPNNEKHKTHKFIVSKSTKETKALRSG